MKILVIDDDPATTEMLKLLLQPVGANVVTSNSSIEGVSLCRELSPDILILDLMMPELDGWMVCSKIRKFSNLPIIMLSAMDSPKSVAKALDEGADDYLIKPVLSGTLIAHINTLLRRSQTPNGKLISQGDKYC